MDWHGGRSGQTRTGQEQHDGFQYYSEGMGCGLRPGGLLSHRLPTGSDSRLRGAIHGSPGNLEIAIGSAA